MFMLLNPVQKRRHGRPPLAVEDPVPKQFHVAIFRRVPLDYHVDLVTGDGGSSFPQVEGHGRRRGV